MKSGELAYRQLIAHLKQVRLAARIHQADLARVIGRDQPYVSRVERGQLDLGIVQFVLWTRALKLDPKEVMQAFAEDVPLIRSRRPRVQLDP